MAMNHCVDVGRARAYVSGVGTVTMSESIAAIEQVAADPSFQPDFTVLFDLRRVDYTADLADGDALAAALKDNKERFGRRFAVVVSDSLFLMVKLYCLLARVGGYEPIKCFTDMSEAERWCSSV